ncbi:transmembrane sensor [Pedobacter africanus]|uniref:Ferric-dicitrate binding protein FerR (Iron transport regulator) n=1 Tax=Pedobacter africanus TaxID=151894 RepID=A0ACC6L2F1_9SPHI|nr:FecR domain-containing protein [Pedobacter africanus]MDR6785506.1 ferric-dicitrate binding protein FerR (iron transport regulator) [Pedobacter africanus]
MNNPKDLQFLIRQYANNNITPDQYQELMLRFNDPESYEMIQEVFDQIWTEGEVKEYHTVQEIDALYTNMKKNPGFKEKPKTRLWKPLWISGIAAVLALMLFGLWFFNNRQNERDQIVLAKARMLTPGKTGATLTLANGKTIVLSNASRGMLGEEAGVKISKSAGGQLVYELSGVNAVADQINTLSTAPGETFSIRLPEGSVVWLNAGSSLSYHPSLLNKGQRRVELKGEGYFEVAKDAAHPFVVQTESQEVEVLGTKFNISNYRNEPEVTTTLLEGSVKVKNARAETLLKPGEHVLNNGNELKVSKTDVRLAYAWKEGYFRFDETGMPDIVKQLERWYNVKIELAEGLTALRLTGKISRNNDISHVLSLIQETNRIRFEIDERRIRITEK